MTASTAFPYALHWDAHALADAVPLRLSELLDFDIRREDARPCANAEAHARHPGLRRGYARSAELPARFNIR